MASADPMDGAPPWALHLAGQVQLMLRRLDSLEKLDASTRTAFTQVARQGDAIRRQLDARRPATDSVLAELHHKLAQLTLKRHACLTATLGGLSYKQITDITGGSVTTVKLQLRDALKPFGIDGRQRLLASHKDLLKPISNAEYRRRYGLSKDWWMENNEDLLAVLRMKKPAANQHTSV